jgi:hypothetical protein
VLHARRYRAQIMRIRDNDNSFVSKKSGRVIYSLQVVFFLMCWDTVTRCGVCFEAIQRNVQNKKKGYFITKFQRIKKYPCSSQKCISY